MGRKRKTLMLLAGILAAVWVGFQPVKAAETAVWAGEAVSGERQEAGGAEETAEGSLTWRQSAEARGEYDFTRGRWMIGNLYLGETIEEILQMEEDPELEAFDWTGFFRHTVFAGMAREDLLRIKDLGFTDMADYLPYIPAVQIGETHPVVTEKNYSSAIGTSEAFHIQSYQLDGNYGVCVQKGAPLKSGCVYTKIEASEGDTDFYCRKTEEILGYGREQQKAMSRILTLVKNSGREAAFPGLPENYWVLFVQAASWSVLDPDTGQACVESQAYLASEISGILQWADFVNDDVSFIAGGRDWGSLACVQSILDWLQNWTEQNGFSRLYWYYVPETEYQAICVPDFDDRVRETGYLSLTKSGTHTGTAANIGGAVYGIYQDEACTAPAGTITTEADGYGKSEALPVGKYWVKEISAADGVCINSKVYSAAVEADQTVSLNVSYVITDDEWQGDLVIRKKNSENGKALPGAVFTLYEYSAVSGEYRSAGELSDEGDGTYTFGSLYYTSENQGRFRAEETEAAPGYVNSGWSREFVLSGEKENFIWDVENEPTRYRFLKTDEEGNPVAGCHFQLCAAEGSVVEEWITDAAGIYDLEGRLEVGKTYILRETGVPIGYRPAIEQTFTVPAFGNRIEITAMNAKIPAQVEIQKVNEAGAPMSGIWFALYSTREAAGGPTQTYKGKVYYFIDQKETGTDGLAVFSGLDAVHGYEYLALEISAEAGYEKIGEPVEIGSLPMVSTEAPEDTYEGEVQIRDSKFYLYRITCQVTNRPEFELPLTGSSAHTRQSVIWMACAVVLCVWMGWNRKRFG
jgi:hypothetical protein